MLVDWPEAYAAGGIADILLIGMASDAPLRPLLHWFTSLREKDELHDLVPEYHRLQLEHWVWHTINERGLRDKRVLDIGAQNPRRWIGSGYRTCGNTPDAQNDILADVANGFLRDVGQDAWDAIICTEVLEHCADPFIAVENMRAALVPGGLLLASSPFLWPDHHTADYPDYWRFTEQGWRLLMQGFSDVQVTPCAWTTEASQLLDLVRRFEGMGWRHEVGWTSGYLVEARS